MYVVWSSAEFWRWSGKWAESDGKYNEENSEADDKLIKVFLLGFFVFKVIPLKKQYVCYLISIF